MAVPKRILIVDDDPAVHGQLVDALQAADREIDSAHDGLKGLALIEATPYDLVLADLTLPGLDGLALLQRTRQLRPAARVVVITDSWTPEDVVRSIREQAFAYFSKPLAMGTVVDIVASALHGSSRNDDIQLLSGRAQWLGVRMRCKIETADRIVQFLRELPADLAHTDRENIAAAFREILVNAIEHGGGSDPKKWVYITYVRTARDILYYVRDPGKGFSLGDLPHAAISNPDGSPTGHAEVRDRLGLRPGGFGILLTRQLVDELIYNEAGNEALLIKHLT
ncbi:MAG TPA: response regulator [Bryobacteraceae bacterium]|nr:response regulator [Bryobacteraceae bacterium]